jgi:hypothetical protein
MSEQLKHNYSVSSEIVEHPAADFSFLRTKAIEYAQEASGTLWTDYNVHDPGMTFLEAFCYTMTEVAYKMSLDLEQLLLHSSSGKKVFPNHFLLHANELLPPKASTVEDYSILLLDQLINDLTHVFVTAEIQDMNGVKGLYTISVIPRQSVSNLEKKKLAQQISSLFLRHRNIGEDLKEVRILAPKLVSIECNVDLSNNIDAHECIAHFFFALNQLLNPTVKFSSLNELIDNGRSIGEIFDNPSFTNGFIDRVSVSKKQKTLHINRIKQLFARQKGVRSINSFHVLIDGILQRDEWFNINEHEFVTVELSFESFDYFTKIQVRQANEIMEIDFSRVFHIYNTLVQEEHAKNVHRFAKPVYPLQNAITKKDLLQYKSIVFDLPGIYRVGSYEATTNEDSSIQANSKQLTMYISFFDDILQSYLVQLTQLEQIFSIEKDAPPPNLEKHVRDSQFQIYQHLLARIGEFGYSNQKIGSSLEIKALQKERLGQIIRFIQKNNRFELAGHFYLKNEDASDIDDFPIKAKLAHISGLNITDIVPLTKVFETINQVSVQELSEESAETDIAEKLFEETSEAMPSGFIFDSPTKDVWKYMLANVSDSKKFSIKKSANKYSLVYKKDEYAKGQLLSRGTKKKVIEKELADFLTVLAKVNNESEGFHLVEHILLRPRPTTKVYFTLNKDGSTVFKSTIQNSYDAQVAMARDTALLAAYKNNYKVVDLKNDEFGVAIKDLSGTVLAQSTEKFITKIGAEDFIKSIAGYFEELKNSQNVTDIISISSPKNYHLSVLDKVGNILFKTQEAQSLDVLHEIQDSMLSLLKISENYKIEQKSSSNYMVKVVVNGVSFSGNDLFNSEESAQKFIEKSLKTYRGIRIISDTSIFFKMNSIYARNADNYNYCLTLLYPDWTTKFQNEQFVHNFIQTVQQEMPSYIKLLVKPFSMMKMQAFEDLYFPWLDILSELDDYNNEQLNLLSSKLLDVLTA